MTCRNVSRPPLWAEAFIGGGRERARDGGRERGRQTEMESEEEIEVRQK